jgi:2-dehydro-3-deoxy-D-arabinonate dehydratase
VLCDGQALRDLEIRAEVMREGATIFQGGTRTSQMKRALEDLVRYLCLELDFPGGVFLMTGTGIVPPPEFTLQRGDRVRVTVGSLSLVNVVDTRPRPSGR